VAHELAPAECSKNEIGVDAQAGKNNHAPIGQSYLRGKNVEIEVDMSARPKNQRNERNQRQNAHDPSTLLQATSVLRITIELYEYVLTGHAQNGPGISTEAPIQ
jgi:hypothetical protein